MRYFLNKYSGTFLLFVVFEQIIVAFSTFCMIKLGTGITDEHSLIWFWEFVISLVIVFVPRIFKQKCMVKAKYASFKCYVSLYEENLYNYPYLKTNHEFCKRRQSFFHNQTWQVIEETYAFVGDFSATVLNVLFNILVIGFSLNIRFIVAYICSACVIAAGLFSTKKIIARKSDVAQVTQSSVQEAMFDGWDTLLIGNRYNWSQWMQSFKAKTKDAEQAEVNYNILNNFLSFLIMAGSIIPIIIVTVKMILNNLNSVGMLTAILVTLPRQVSNIQYLSIVIEYLTELVGIKEKINNINDALKKVEHPEKYYGTIQWNNISFFICGRENIFCNLEECMNFLAERVNNGVPGRLVIKGKNGSGKTTLLMLIKEYFGNDAYLFPNHTRLYFEKNDVKEYSTGQRFRANIEDLIKNNIQSQVKLILFDEWNANLDIRNQAAVSEYIDQLATTLVVVEVRNREL
ncbi:hypothetical protein [Faecalicatena orotica]|uniref:Uncharacterized protein n=1 Tax=Faecalicatena orotica TaxID=1544 RepID=A0A2Y9BHS5_9FIRM|nr:hypothetical protein [Faecalicatena orotica]PWJ29440.1 hypothetical protein A8806_106178 [Faecalicatena orotica]SSA55895.1 hypothetical protein SAMN05216536_106178 [Faecalicatena orotica]